MVDWTLTLLAKIPLSPLSLSGFFIKATEKSLICVCRIKLRTELRVLSELYTALWLNPALKLKYHVSSLGMRMGGLLLSPGAHDNLKGRGKQESGS